MPDHINHDLSIRKLLNIKVCNIRHQTTLQLRELPRNSIQKINSIINKIEVLPKDKLIKPHLRRDVKSIRMMLAQVVRWEPRRELGEDRLSRSKVMKANIQVQHHTIRCLQPMEEAVVEVLLLHQVTICNLRDRWVLLVLHQVSTLLKRLESLEEVHAMIPTLNQHVAPLHISGRLNMIHAPTNLE